MQPQKDVLNVLKPFPLQILVRNQNYGGFDRSTWKAQTNDGHRVAALKIKHARTQTEKLKLKHSEGIQFGELTRLSYFDSITFFAIDPMHNLWLGAAKHMLKLWKSLDTLTAERLLCIQSYDTVLSLPQEKILKTQYWEQHWECFSSQ